MYCKKILLDIGFTDCNYFTDNNTLSHLRHPVLDYSGEHNISIITNPYGFFLLFSCYLLLRAYALPKIRSPKGGN